MLRNNAVVEEVVEDGACGIDADDFDVRVFLLEVTADSGDGPAGPHADDEVRDPALAILPELGAGGPVVTFGIGGIRVLIGMVGARNVVRELLDHLVIAARIVYGHSGRADDDLGAQGLEQIDLFLGLLVGHGEDGLVALDDGHQREAHAGVSRSALHNRAAGLEPSTALGLFDHGDGNSIFDAAARVQVVALGVHLGFRAAHDAVQLDERRVANGFEDVVVAHARTSDRA